MLKILGAMVILFASFLLGALLSDGIKKRIESLELLAKFAEYISDNISMYKTPLAEIYSEIKDESLVKSGFANKLSSGVYAAAMSSGLISGDEEREIIRDFDEKIGNGTAEDMVKLCSYTASRLRSIADTLSRDYPDKKRVYRTVSFMAGASAVIILL